MTSNRLNSREATSSVTGSSKQQVGGGMAQAWTGGGVAPAPVQLLYFPSYVAEDSLKNMAGGSKELKEAASVARLQGHPTNPKP